MRDEIERWLRDLGFDVPELRFDGEFVRFGDKKSSWFVAREFISNNDIGKTYYAATVGDWKLGEIHHFQNTIKLKVSEKKQIKAQQEIYQARIHREISEQHEKAAKDSEIIFGTFKHGEHPYADKKGIKVMPDCRVNEDYLAIPLKDVNGKFWSFQKIYPDSAKRFFAGGRTKNNFYQFGKIENKIFICEGYATGYTIFEKENEAVICAMSAGNIPNVAKALREKYPHLEFIYMADRDTHGKGEEMCKKAMAITGGELRFPPEGYKDFNDARQTDLVPVIDDEIIVGQLPDMTTGGKPRPMGTINNLKELLKFLKIQVRYNAVSKNEEILIPGKNFTVDNKLNASLSWIISMAIKAGMPSGNIQEYVLHLADENVYNPVVNWILSKPWDGKDRLTEMYQTVTCTDEARDGLLKETLMKRWFISAVAAIFEQGGISAHGMLVFQGAQATGKTYWFKKLAPSHLNVIKDGLTLKPDDRDSVKRAVSFWLVELGELDATFRKADIAQLKSFMTSDKDVLRLSFARKESEFARRTIFFGSVNDQEFLADKTGNRRFWVIECAGINYKHEIDMQQFWAQIYLIYKLGEPWILQPDELLKLNESNAKHEFIEPLEEMLMDAYDWSLDKSFWERKSATQITLEIGKKDARKSDVNSIANIVKKLSGTDRDRLRRFLCPPLLRKGL
jgi:putative DNA primase/helicase